VTDGLRTSSSWLTKEAPGGHPGLQRHNAGDGVRLRREAANALAQKRFRGTAPRCELTGTTSAPLYLALDLSIAFGDERGINSLSV
jgi:hypothetical protein